MRYELFKVLVNCCDKLLFVGGLLLLLVILSFIFKFIVGDIRRFLFLGVVIGGGDCFWMEVLFNFGFICCFGSIFVFFFFIWFCERVGWRVEVVGRDFIDIGFVGEIMVGVFEE